MKHLFLLLTLVCILSLQDLFAKKAAAFEIHGAYDEPGGDDQANDTYENKLDQLLTLTMAAATVEKPAAEAKTKYNKIMKNPGYHSISYSWKSNRTTEVKGIAGKPMQVTASDVVELSMVRATTLEKFKNDYRNNTAEELRQLNEMVNKKVNEAVKDGKVDKAAAKAVTGSTVATVAEQRWEDVAGVGSFARWNKQHQHLNVFHKGQQFQLRVSISNDEIQNKQKAIELAKQVIGKF